jgi:hypothetical protein
MCIMLQVGFKHSSHLTLHTNAISCFETVKSPFRMWKFSICLTLQVCYEMVGFSIDLCSINQYASVSFPAKPLRVWIPDTHYQCFAFLSGHPSPRRADHISCSSKWWTVSKKSVHIIFLFVSLINHQLQRDTVLQASCLFPNISILFP